MINRLEYTRIAFLDFDSVLCRHISSNKSLRVKDVLLEDNSYYSNKNFCEFNKEITPIIKYLIHKTVHSAELYAVCIEEITASNYGRNTFLRTYCPEITSVYSVRDKKGKIELLDYVSCLFGYTREELLIIDNDVELITEADSLGYTALTSEEAFKYIKHQED